MARFINTAESRKTSPKIMRAILAVAEGDEREAEFIWENGPDHESFCEVVDLVTDGGRIAATNYRWGRDGLLWAGA